MAGSGKSIEHYVRVGPKILRKADCTIRNKKSAEGESITHQKIPHHQLSILQVKWALTPTPPICFRYSSCRHNSFQFIICDLETVLQTTISLLYFLRFPVCNEYSPKETANHRLLLA